MINSELSLSVLPQKIAVCRFDKDAVIPDWYDRQSFYSITKTDDELSLVCSQEHVPEDVKAEKDWRAFKIEGPLDFSLVGIFASIANALAEARISIFAVSTYDTDYVLVKQDKLEQAVKVLGSFCNVNS
jgi:uncharacterized protein